MDAMADIPLEDIRDYVAGLEYQQSTCKTCGEPIRTTPSVHKDGSVHWASNGWEHIKTEKSGCGKSYPYSDARPIEDL